jgi:hypothetical protein
MDGGSDMILCGAHSSATTTLKFLQPLQADSGATPADAFTITSTCFYFWVTRPGPAIDLLRCPLQRKPAPLKILQLGEAESGTNLQGRIHNHGAAPHDIFLTDDGSEIDLLQVPTPARNSAAKKFLQLVASRVWRHSCEGRIHNHEGSS